jgi:hypothetical protein
MLLLKSAGYIAAFSLNQNRSYPFKEAMNISRIHINPEDSIHSFAFNCSGINRWVNKLRAKIMIRSNNDNYCFFNLFPIGTVSALLTNKEIICGAAAWLPV